MAFRKISLPNGLSQWCFVKGASSALDRICNLRLVKHDVRFCSSEIFIDEKMDIFLKAPPIKSFFKNNLMKLINWTPADKETRGSLVLRKLGIETSEVLARAIPLNPFSPHRSLLYCKYIKASITFDEFLKQYPKSPQRQELLDTVAAQMSTMFCHGVSFRDFYFGNILYSEGRLIWIDTEIQKYWIRTQKPSKRFIKKKKFMCDRFLRNGGRVEEWDRFWRIALGL